MRRRRQSAGRAWAAAVLLGAGQSLAAAGGASAQDEAGDAVVRSCDSWVIPDWVRQVGFTIESYSVKAAMPADAYVILNGAQVEGQLTLTDGGRLGVIAPNRPTADGGRPGVIAPKRPTANPDRLIAFLVNRPAEFRPEKGEPIQVGSAFLTSLPKGLTKVAISQCLAASAGGAPTSPETFERKFKGVLVEDTTSGQPRLSDIKSAPDPAAAPDRPPAPKKPFEKPGGGDATPSAPGPGAPLELHPNAVDSKAGEKQKEAVAETGADGAEAGQKICRSGKSERLPVAGAKFQPAQVVGLRSEKQTLNAFEFDRLVGEVIDLKRTIASPDSKGKLTAYEFAVLKDKLWVSIPALGEGSKDPPKKAPYSLRVLVFSGAEELAKSGLEQIDAELQGQGRGGYQASIEWQMLDQTGSPSPAGRYASFGELIRAARDRSAGGSLSVLDPTAVLTFFDSFERVIRAQTAPVDEVIWIKGAYRLASDTPHRFEQLLKSVASSGLVGPKWLDIVSAQTLGFSLYYLKGPLSEQQAGDLFEERDGGGDRKLLAKSEAFTLTARVIARSGLRSGEASANGENAPNIVFDANEAFEERGFAWAADVVVALSQRVARMSALWGAGPSEDADKTLEQVLQQPDAFPRLPKDLTAAAPWLRIKRIRDLSADESAQAEALLKRVARGLDTAAQTAKEPGCASVYAPEAAFGFSRSGVP